MLEVRKNFLLFYALFFFFFPKPSNFFLKKKITINWKVLLFCGLKWRSKFENLKSLGVLTDAALTSQIGLDLTIPAQRTMVFVWASWLVAFGVLSVLAAFNGNLGFQIALVDFSLIYHASCSVMALFDDFEDNFEFSNPHLFLFLLSLIVRLGMTLPRHTNIKTKQK